MSKRTLDAFFKPKTTTPPTKRPKPTPTPDNSPPLSTEDITAPDTHPSYPSPIPQLPSHISIALTHGTPAKEPRAINNQPDLDLLYFQPYITRPTANELFKFLRRELPFYRVKYTIKRGGIETEINTPRYTTVFGVDDTSQFTSYRDIKSKNKNEDEDDEDEITNPNENSTSSFSNLSLTETTSKTPIRNTKYQYTPRPIPTCLNQLKARVEAATGSRYNFCLVNYYSSGNDSIAFHSDDERFLGASPDIASLSLGGEREFVMKHKPVPPRHTGSTTSLTSTSTSASPSTAGTTLKFPLSSGDMILMRGSTQSNWLHSIPKRKGRSGEAVEGRINITFRRAMVPAGTNNYYRYNVGDGSVWRWDGGRGEMVCVEEEKEEQEG